MCDTARSICALTWPVMVSKPYMPVIRSASTTKSWNSSLSMLSEAPSSELHE